MNERHFYAIVTGVTIFLGSLIAWGIITTQLKAEAIKLSLEKGINPLYVKCSFEGRTEECKSMIMAMSLSGQFKDTTAPVAISPASQSKK